MDEKYKDQGLQILLFPCNQFLNQESGTNEEIKKQTMESHDVRGTLFSKLEVNGPNTHDVYKFLRSADLKNQTPEKNHIEWNFAKFLVDRDGRVVKRYGPAVNPSAFDIPEKLPAWLAGAPIQ